LNPGLQFQIDPPSLDVDLNSNLGTGGMDRLNQFVQTGSELWIVDPELMGQPPSEADIGQSVLR